MCTTMSHRRSTFLEISSEGQWPFSLLFSRCHAIKLLLFYCDCTWHTGLHNAKYRMHKYTNTQILPQILPLHIAYRVAHCKIQNAHQALHFYNSLSSKSQCTSENLGTLQRNIWNKVIWKVGEKTLLFAISFCTQYAASDPIL